MARRMKPEGGATALAPPADHPSADAEAAVFVAALLKPQETEPIVVG